MQAVIAMPTISGMWNSSDSPMAPPRNSARSVAIAAISLTTHIAHTTGRENRSRHMFREVPSGDDAELGGQRLEQHGDEIGGDHHPEQVDSRISRRPGCWWRNCRDPYRRSRRSPPGRRTRTRPARRHARPRAPRAQSRRCARSGRPRPAPLRCRSSRSSAHRSAAHRSWPHRSQRHQSWQHQSWAHSSPSPTLKCSSCYMWGQSARFVNPAQTVTEAADRAMI